MKLKNSISFVAVSILGILSMILPVYILGDVLKHYDSPLFPILRTGLEGLSAFSIVFLLLSGFAVKLFSAIPSWKIGLMSVALLPLAAVCEMVADSSSHTLFPIEFIIYGFYTIPAIIGAYCAELLKFTISQIIKFTNKKF